jgi:hypothetical protein
MDRVTGLHLEVAPLVMVIHDAQPSGWITSKSTQIVF